MTHSDKNDPPARMLACGVVGLWTRYGGDGCFLRMFLLRIYSKKQSLQKTFELFSLG